MVGSKFFIDRRLEVGPIVRLKNECRVFSLEFSTFVEVKIRGIEKI